MKKLITTTSLFALMLATPVLAQTSESPTNENSKPAIEQPSNPSQPQTGPAVKDDTAMPSADRPKSEDTAANPVDAQPATGMGDQWRASKLIGQPVNNAGNEKIGDINDFVLASDGSIEHVLVGVGGFLGLGEKVVALKFDELTFTKGTDGKYLISTAATKKSLEAAPEWKSDAAK
ncbi:MAG: PRC-barrel domain-containing protein [Alphaproteobacteria bacterium]|nr:PRC-barrel domain-containing protein [Alphaproteobacteria bacterium]